MSNQTTEGVVRDAYAGPKKFSIHVGDAGSEAYRDEYVRWLERALSLAISVAPSYPAPVVTVNGDGEATRVEFRGEAVWTCGRLSAPSLRKALAEANAKPAELSSLSPEPGEQSPAWMIAFEDKDYGSAVFTGAAAETAARKAFGRASVTMTCRLYRCVAQSGYGPQPETKEVL